jgi:hypothetical protein
MGSSWPARLSGGEPPSPKPPLPWSRLWSRPWSDDDGGDDDAEDVVVLWAAPLLPARRAGK